MKKTISLILVLLLAISFTGCNAEKEDNKVKIVTTLFPFYDFAKHVAGDKAEITLLLPTGAEAHSYEPTAKDVVAIQECDLFICQGMGADPWITSIIKESTFDESKVIYALECADVFETGHEHNNVFSYDGHVWTSLRYSQNILQCIADELSKRDSENKSFYQENAKNYIDELSQLDDDFTKLTENKDITLVFADRFPFSYFVNDYQIKSKAAYPGCSTESEPSAATVASIIDFMKEENIKVVFVTETSNGRLADTICKETGAEKRLLHSCHTVTKKELQEGITYLNLMRKNYETLEELYK